MEEFYKNGIRGFRHMYDQPYALNSSSVCVDSDYIARSLEVARELNCSELSFVGEYRLNDLSFIKNHDLSFVKGISITKSITDFSPLYSIGEQITHFTFDSSSIENIDLAYFPNLEFLGCTWNNRILNINSCVKLQRIKMGKYRRNDLLEFKDLKNMRKLEMINSSLKNLHGIEQWNRLEILDLYSSRSLLSLDGIQKEMENLKFIRVYGASKLYNVDIIGKLKGLRRLHLARVKNLKSLKFLDSFKTLEMCSIHPANVKVEDEDFSPVNRLKKRSGIKL